LQIAKLPEKEFGGKVRLAVGVFSNSGMSLKRSQFGLNRHTG
jgi:hypothetical protein